MINKRQRDELLTSFFPKDKEILVNAYNLQLELQEKETFERTLIDVTRQVLDLKEKLDRTRHELFMATCHIPYYERFEVRA